MRRRLFLKRTGILALGGATALSGCLTGGDGTGRTPDPPVEEGPEVENFLTGLEVPWDLSFAPDGRILFTERPGRLRVIEGGSLSEKPYWAPDAPVFTDGEAGLLGLALHPGYPSTPYIYVYYTYESGSGPRDRISRLTEREGDGIVSEEVLLDDIPGASIHDGGRLEFGPDGHLYATTGDAARSSLAQDKSSPAGKILRMTDAGEPVEDNPFPENRYVYSYGHRNPQGMAFTPDGELYATEHGSIGHDELNLIERDGNYGWPVRTGAPGTPGYLDPVAHSGTDTWAPTGLHHYEGPIERLDGKLLFTSLQTESLHVLEVEGREVRSHEQLFAGRFGRLRDVTSGPDGDVYLLTSNRDGRGSPAAEDDRILRVKQG